jgi:hypothetical protein
MSITVRKSPPSTVAFPAWVAFDLHGPEDIFGLGHTAGEALAELIRKLVDADLGEDAERDPIEEYPDPRAYPLADNH